MLLVCPIISSRWQFTSPLDSLGCILVYLPPYPPDLNPIEESFSACMFRILSISKPWIKASISPVKAYLRRRGLQIREDENPEMALMEACACVTAEKAWGWFHHAGYIWNDFWLVICPTIIHRKWQNTLLYKKWGLTLIMSLIEWTMQIPRATENLTNTGKQRNKLWHLTENKKPGYGNHKWKLFLSANKTWYEPEYYIRNENHSVRSQREIPNKQGGAKIQTISQWPEARMQLNTTSEEHT